MKRKNNQSEANKAFSEMQSRVGTAGVVLGIRQDEGIDDAARRVVHDLRIAEDQGNHWRKETDNLLGLLNESHGNLDQARELIKNLHREIDLWRSRARTQNALVSHEALRWDILYRCTGSIEILTKTLGNIFQKIDTQQKPGEAYAMIACPICGGVGIFKRNAIFPRSGWRLCDKCEATHPNPWAAVDALTDSKAPNSAYSVAE